MEEVCSISNIFSEAVLKFSIIALGSVREINWPLS